MVKPQAFKDSLIKSFGIAVNIAFAAAAFAAAWYLFYAGRIVSPFYRRGNWVIVLIFVLLYFLLCRLYRAFLVSVSSFLELFSGQLLAAGLSCLLMYVLTWILSKGLQTPLPLLAAFVLQVLFSGLWCLAAKKWYNSRSVPEATVIIDSGRQNIGELIDRYELNSKFELLFSASAAECLQDLSRLDAADTVFLGEMSVPERNEILNYCISKDIKAYLDPRIDDVFLSSAQRVQLFYRTILLVGGNRPEAMFLLIKRLFDILFSAFALLLTSPLLLITALIIKLYDGGPVLYTQERLTKDGEVFRMHKFRSMAVDAEKDGVAQLSSGRSDPRATPFGRVIRRLRIDELPQFYDILRGKMSVVGPRPEREEFARLYEKELPAFSQRLQVKAGLTGYAQVYGRYNTTSYEKLQMDLLYITRPSLLEDLRLCLATLKVPFLPESTEGFSQEAGSNLRSDGTEQE